MIRIGKMTSLLINILLSQTMIYAQYSGDNLFVYDDSLKFEYSDNNNGIEAQIAPSYQEEASRMLYCVGIRYKNMFDPSRCRPVAAKIYYPYSKHSPSPVVIFSHGLGGSYERCDYLGQKWASEGMISIHINHCGCDDSVWKNKIRPLKELKQVYPAFWSGRVHAEDIRFVLDELNRLSIMEPGLADMMDLSRIGVAGYDIGGLAALLLAGQHPPDNGASLYDERVKAVLVMSPPVYPTRYSVSSVYEAIHIPTFFVTGTEDNGVIGSTKAEQRRIPFDCMVNTDRYLVTYQGADHMIYGGHILSINGRNDKQFQDNIARISSLYWKAYLNGDLHAYHHFARHSIGRLVTNMGRIERKFPQTLQPGFQDQEVTTNTTY